MSYNFKAFYCRNLLLICLLVYISGCNVSEEKHFTLLTPTDTNIDFENRVENNPEFNIINYLYFYDGGGVAAGDINNDGLPDLFFVGNDSPNRLYLNLGDFKFEDITENSGISHDPGSWSTGISMADVNGDGYLDIYICRVNYLTKSGPNQLYINNGDQTFTERAAEYGLDFEGYSTQAVFFDYNQNGRLDMFLLNHSFHSEKTYGEVEALRQVPDHKAGDRLLRNDGDYFTDVTAEAGIRSSAVGYGLGVALSDINLDGYPDIYVGNDFHEDDYFYINNGDGTFTESLYSMMGHTSNSSMGNDIADINNDGFADIVSLDMMPDTHEPFMSSGGADPVLISETKKRFGFGSKNNRNTLQINQGIGPEGLPLFSETAFASGIAKTEWSWAPLFADFNNNGLNDLFITNGIPRRPNDLDFINRIRRLRQQLSVDELQNSQFELIETMPSVYTPNVMYKNNGDLSFTDVSDEWGFAKSTFSSGAVYSDLNKDGRLDIVVNNTNEKAFIYRNNAQESDSSNYLKIRLKGDGKNTTGIGSKIILYSDKEIFYREQFPVRGFQSSIDHTLHFGLGETSVIDSMLVIWPDDRFEILEKVGTNQLIELLQENASDEFNYSELHSSNSDNFLEDITDQTEFDHSHIENRFSDFEREPLIPYKLSTRGPAFATADINGDGLDDFYIGGSHGYQGKLFVQQPSGSFQETNSELFAADKESEDTGAIFFDATGNGLKDLYVVSGGNELTENSPYILDRLYINRGDGLFEKSNTRLPRFAVNGSIVTAADYNGDGAMDLFVGGHSIPWRYGVGPRSFILENNGEGVFENVTAEVAPELLTVGNVTAAEWIQNPNDELPDLVVVGEWMPVHYFDNNDGLFTLHSEFNEKGILSGLWQSVHVDDLTGNGYPDIILGNFGINSRFENPHNNPIKMYINDFDGNGQTAPLITYFENEREVPFEQLDELMAQMPDITQKVQNYRDFAGKTVEELFDPDMLGESLIKEIHELRSIIILNNGNGSFKKRVLPFEAQIFPVLSIYTDDIDGDGNTDLMMGGNIYDVKPSIGGRQDAGYGLILKGDGNGGFTSVPFQKSGFLVRGEFRAIQELRIKNGETQYIVIRNNDHPLFFKKRN